MKKTLYSILMLAGLLVAFTSCEKEEIGDTAGVKTAGDWYVTVDAVDANGGLVFSDEELFGMGQIHVLTYNTAANIPTEMIDNLKTYGTVNIDASKSGYSEMTTTMKVFA